MPFFSGGGGARSGALLPTTSMPKAHHHLRSKSSLSAPPPPAAAGAPTPPPPPTPNKRSAVRIPIAGAASSKQPNEPQTRETPKSIQQAATSPPNPTSPARPSPLRSNGRRGGAVRRRRPHGLLVDRRRGEALRRPQPRRGGCPGPGPGAAAFPAGAGGVHDPRLRAARRHVRSEAGRLPLRCCSDTCVPRRVGSVCFGRFESRIVCPLGRRSRCLLEVRGRNPRHRPPTPPNRFLLPANLGAIRRSLRIP
jgi:hypothetical protein